MVTEIIRWLHFYTSSEIASYDSDRQVRWQRIYNDPADGTLKTQSISQDLAMEDNIQYGIEKPSPFTWRLRIRAVQIVDNGNYMCFVQVTLISKVFANRTLTVVCK